jgi:CDP-diacylglycerol---glycerol-3-phosphate 3-phosphatidyltransferase
MHHAGLYAIKPRFQQLLDGPTDFLVRRRVHPDVLTYAGVACGVLGGIALLNGALFLWWVPLLALARLTFNALDGMVAMRSGLARPWGKVLNEFCDRLADLAFLWPLLVMSGASMPLTTLALAATLLVSYLGVLAEAAGARREYGGVMGKADRMLWLGLACAATAASGDPLWLRLLPAVLLGGALITLVQRGGRIHAAL